MSGTRAVVAPAVPPVFDRLPKARDGPRDVRTSTVNARSRLRATQPSPLAKDRSRKVLGEVVLPVMDGKLAA